MRVERADERDSSWEKDDARYRVFVYDGPSAATTAFDIEGLTLTEALEHARMASENDRRLWSLAVLVDDADGRRGLVWLSGMDYHDVPVTPIQRARRREMQDRYLMARSRDGQAPVLPDGRRVIRMFPEWGAGPLWENFTENYPLDPATLGLADDLVAALLAWNREWNAREPEQPLPDAAAWRARGDVLADRLEAALSGVAELRREFSD